MNIYSIISYQYIKVYKYVVAYFRERGTPNESRRGMYVWYSSSSAIFMHGGQNNGTTNYVPLRYIQINKGGHVIKRVFFCFRVTPICSEIYGACKQSYQHQTVLIYTPRVVSVTVCVRM